MIQHSAEQEHSSRFFWFFVLLHVVVWLLLPLLTKPNFPLDVIECYIYGQQWALASAKHPPLPSWTTVLISSMTGQSIAAPYIASQLFVFFAFFANWKLATSMLPLKKAFLVVALMECYTYYTFYSLEFNNSMSLLGCWSLASLSFYSAIQQGKMRYWLATGLFLGLGVMGKYSGFILVMVLLAFMVYEPKARKYWKTPGPYLTTLIAFLLFLPHFLTILSSNFATLGYIAHRVEETTPNRINHLLFPLRFFLTQLGVILPILLGFLFFSGGKFRRRPLQESERFDARFLVFLVLVPSVFQLLLSLLFSVKLSTIYGSHLWIFLGLFLVFFLEVDESLLSRKKITALFLIAMICMAGLTATRDVVYPYWTHQPSRIHYPGRDIARLAEEAWHQRHAGRLPHLVGEWWLTGQVVAYGKDRPGVFCYISADRYDKRKVLSLWSDKEDAAREGGVCLWDESHYPQKVPPLLLEEYPDAEILPSVSIPFQTGAEMPPLRLGMAVIPPAKESH